jgi:hypothetical protein
VRTTAAAHTREPICQADTLGEKRQALIIEAAKREWSNARSEVLGMMAYLVCCYCVRRVRHARLESRGIDAADVVGLAQEHLIRQMDRKNNGRPFLTCPTDFDIWRTCWGFICYCTLSAVRDTWRQMPRELLLGDDAEQQSQKEPHVDGGGLPEILQLCISQLTPKQQGVIPVLMGTMTQADLARETGKSEAAVHKLCERTKQRLRDLLGEQGGAS